MFTKATTTTAFIAALVAARPVFAIPSGDDEEKSDKAAQSDDGGIASPSTCGGQKLVAPDAGAGDLAGMVAALDGDTLLMGAPWDDNAAGADAGKVVAWEYFNGAWQQIPSPVPNNPQAGAFFGRSVGLAGDIAVVGAPLQNNYKGAG